MVITNTVAELTTGLSIGFAIMVIVLATLLAREKAHTDAALVCLETAINSLRTSIDSHDRTIANLEIANKMIRELQDRVVLR